MTRRRQRRKGPWEGDWADDPDFVQVPGHGITRRQRQESDAIPWPGGPSLEGDLLDRDGTPLLEGEPLDEEGLPINVITIGDGNTVIVLIR